MALRIHTLGTSVLSRTAELAVVALEVSDTGITQSSVLQEVTRTSNNLQSMLEALAPGTSSGADHPDTSTLIPPEGVAITRWSMSSLSTGSYIPWDSQRVEEQQGKPVHTARTTFQITFCDFAKLGQVVSDLIKLPCVSVMSIDWRLTDATKQQMSKTSRKQAVENAVTKARDYADVLRKTHVEALEVNDIDPGGYPRPAAAYASNTNRLLASGAHQDGALHFTPQSCDVQCSVKVLFEAT
ncbi:hypothetical protein DL771_006751 [Monosporascus sp. 5C6A]|nr:hypothetical protein DL771_006751 [Monosporascus sp. 5C6A]